MAKPISLEFRKDQVPQELIDLKSHIEQLPLPLRDKMLPLVDRLGHYTRLQGRLVRIAQDAVDQLQLDIKYLLFDLDATRRERDDLAGRSEETGIEGGEPEAEME
ncbi:MAG: hypothetical protein K2X38_07835 [Gemmataceae bacterium]|nr:hypothetical protein [Gemmataceae bacterium]